MMWVNMKLKRATVLGRADKVTGKYMYSSSYNIRDMDTGVAKSIDLTGTSGWEKLDDNEEVNIVLVPISKQNNKECDYAKKVEVEKLRQFGVYEELKDEGQNCLSTRWVVWRKGDDMRARLVVRGFEEQEELEKDSPTLVKSTMKRLLVIAACHGWPIQTTDIRSAFL